MSDEVLYFATPSDWRKWLEENHERVSHQLVGFYKKGTGEPSITWPESVDQALCYGWIDGVRKGIDEERYMIRFTPRKATSIWSAVNIARVAELTEQGFMLPGGLAAFEKRKQEKSVIYSHEQKDMIVELDPASDTQLRANERAWYFFQNQSLTYRKAVIWWIKSAKREDTKQKRLANMIEHSEQGKRLAQFTWTKST